MINGKRPEDMSDEELFAAKREQERIVWALRREVALRAFYERGKIRERLETAAKEGA